MKSLILISALCLQLSWSYADPSGPQGVGVFAYQDSSGHRYSGSYGIKDGQIHKIEGDDPTVFKDFQNTNNFFPQYFGNLNDVLQETFSNNLNNQQLALDAAKKAYELTANKGFDYSSFVPNFGDRYNPFSSSGFVGFGNMPGFGGVPNYGPDFSNFGNFGPGNVAQAAASAGPGFTQHFDSINPVNPNIPNVNVVNRFAETSGGKPNFYSVSSSSYSKSSNVDGKEVNERGAETVVNNNGKVTKHSVHS